jgi:hypothetical protein
METLILRVLFLHDFILFATLCQCQNKKITACICGALVANCDKEMHKKEVSVAPAILMNEIIKNINQLSHVL